MMSSDREDFRLHSTVTIAKTIGRKQKEALHRKVKAFKTAFGASRGRENNRVRKIF